LKVATLTTASVTGFGIFGSASKAGLVSNAALSFGPYTAPSPLYLSPNATQLLFWISSIRLFDLQKSKKPSTCQRWSTPNASASATAEEYPQTA